MVQPVGVNASPAVAHAVADTELPLYPVAHVMDPSVTLKPVGVRVPATDERSYPSAAEPVGVAQSVRLQPETE